jgi:hypothetical protein
MVAAKKPSTNRSGTAGSVSKDVSGSSIGQKPAAAKVKRESGKTMARDSGANITNRQAQPPTPPRPKR